MMGASTGTEIGAKKRRFMKAAALPFALFLSFACEAEPSDDEGIDVSRVKAEVPITKIEACIAEYDRCTAPANARYEQCLASGAGWVSCGAALDAEVAPCVVVVDSCLNTGV